MPVAGANKGGIPTGPCARAPRLQSLLHHEPNSGVEPDAFRLRGGCSACHELDRRKLGWRVVGALGTTPFVTGPSRSLIRQPPVQISIAES